MAYRTMVEAAKTGVAYYQGCKAHVLESGLCIRSDIIKDTHYIVLSQSSDSDHSTREFSIGALKLLLFILDIVKQVPRLARQSCSALTPVKESPY